MRSPLAPMYLLAATLLGGLATAHALDAAHVAEPADAYVLLVVRDTDAARFQLDGPFTFDDCREAIAAEPLNYVDESGTWVPLTLADRLVCSPEAWN